MIDRRAEKNIRAVQDFIEMWGKLHSLYEDAISRGIITEDDERKFMDSKDTLRSKYEEMNKVLDFRYMPHSRLTDPVSDILMLGGIRFMSEKNLKKLSDDWRDSYIFLNGILERLKGNKKRLEQFHPIRVFIKRLFERRLS